MMTMKEVMKKAHAMAKTFEGNSYSAKLQLALKIIHRENKESIAYPKRKKRVVKSAQNVPTITVAIDFNKFSTNLVDIVLNAIDKAKASDNKKAELKNQIFNNANNDAQLVGMFIHTFEKSFMKVVSANTHKDYVYGLEAVFSEAMVNLMTKVHNGYIIEKSIKQAFKYEVMNIVKKETRRNQKNTYNSMDSEDFIEEDFTQGNTVADSFYYNKIPVDSILREMDMSHMLNGKQKEVFDYMVKGYSKTKIDEIFGQRMDRTYNAIKEIIEAYVKYEYSEKLYA